jgi:predicted signal transduction protein with EAL and GGDEF domain
VRRQDTVARLSGDEFVVILEGINSSDEAAHLAEKLGRVLREPFSIEEHELSLGASIGISLYPHDGCGADALLKQADAAMYRAKAAGRGSYQFFSQDMTAQAFERVVMENQLRRALAQDELLLHYQPQLDLVTGAVVGLEALLRWQHPEQGLVPPGRFIPLAEETGLITPIGEWVLRTACAQAQAWRQAGLPFGRIAVNIAGPQLQREGLSDTVRAVLDETGLPPACLELEITETLVMRQVERTIDWLQALQALGVMLAIDDFGTGYSSLAYLKRLPVDKLKIDRSFVRDLPGDENDAAIARAVIALGHSMRLMVIAEGVETVVQRDFLRESGCDQVQGFLYSRPLPAVEAEAFLRAAAISRATVEAV